jgi:hypothetical protein
VKDLSEQSVNDLPLPPLLLELLAENRWRNPGETVLRAAIPWIEDPLVFLGSPREMERESQWQLFMDPPDFAEFVHYVRGSQTQSPVVLPWLDVEQAVFIVVNRHPGDDQGIALDYRTSHADPRVVASDWSEPPPAGCFWREVAPTFSAFVGLLGL